MWALGAIPLLLVAANMARESWHRRHALHGMRGYYKARARGATAGDVACAACPKYPMKPEDVLT